MRRSRSPTLARAVPRAAVRSDRTSASADNWSRRLTVGLLFAPMPWLMRLVAAVQFRAIHVRHAERIAPRGPILVVANHPATWTDVLVLHVALRRKLHFLAHETLFQPRPRAWLLRLFGALPVAQPGDASGREARNQATFRRCHDLLSRGEAVAIFPEGVSAVDGSLRAFKAGAARIAYDSESTHVRVIPVGIHYVNRIAFRTSVVVSVGSPIDLPVGDALDEHLEIWITTVTSRLERAVSKLVVDLPSASIRAVFEELAPLAADERSSGAGFERRQRLAWGLAALQRDRPECFAWLEGRVRRHRRTRMVLGLPRCAPSRSSRPPRTTPTFTFTVGAAPAMVGLVLNGIPALITERVARSFDPTRVALARMTAGAAVFGLWYAAIVGVTGLVTHSWWLAIAAILMALVLGGYTVVWSDDWGELLRRRRWVRAARRSPKLMRRLLRERRACVALIERACSRHHPAGEVPR